MSEGEFVEALLVAYNAGCKAAIAVNLGRRGFTNDMAKKERATLNRLMRQFCNRPLNDEEFKMFEG